MNKSYIRRRFSAGLPYCQRTVFEGKAARRDWMMFTDGTVSVSLIVPGYEVVSDPQMFTDLNAAMAFFA